MAIELKQFTTDHRYLMEIIKRDAGFEDPIAIDLDEFAEPLLKKAKRLQILPIDGVLIRDWDPDDRHTHPGVQLGMRLYEIDEIPFAVVHFNYHSRIHWAGLNFSVVDRKNYQRLYKIALRCRREHNLTHLSPILPEEYTRILWNNTIGFLEQSNLKRIKEYGGRARRGILLVGPPGNGKTMACRWLWETCKHRNWEWRIVSPDSYRQARSSHNPEEALRELFTVDQRGIIFFDDMDIALRDRDRGYESEDQSIFLTALDGINVNEGVVFVFTTNCSLDLIDRAFKRPGRIDVVLHFKPPTEELRHQLIKRWHNDILQSIDLEQCIHTTRDFSFAEIEELRNLLILHYMDHQVWDWERALQQFAENRNEFNSNKPRAVGFAPVYPDRNGVGEED